MKGNCMEKYNIGNYITNRTNSVWMLQIFYLVEKILGLWFIGIILGANEGKKKKNGKL